LGALKRTLAHNGVTQNTCSHDAKVRMAGLKNMYECTNCHKFIPIIESKEIVIENKK